MCNVVKKNIKLTRTNFIPLKTSVNYCFFLTTCAQSYFPLTTVSLTPGRSCVRPPCTNTTLCSWRLWPSPGMNTTASFPLERRTRAHLRFAELGFFGFLIMVFRTIALSCGRPKVALTFLGGGEGFPLRCIWLRVAIDLVNIGPGHEYTERDAGKTTT